MGRFSEKQLLIATVIGVAVVVLGGGAGLYLFYSQHGEIMADIAKLNQDLDGRKKMAQRNEDLKQSFAGDTYTRETALFDEQLPVESSTGDTDFWIFLNSKKRGLSVLFRKVEGVQERAGQVGFTPPTGVRKMVYRIEMRGKFYDILEYLSTLENEDRVIRIEHFSFKRKQSTGAEGKEAADVVVDAVVRLMGFEYAAAPAAGAPAAPAR